VERRQREIAAAASSVDSGSGTVLITDMYGGTPCNLALTLLQRGRIEVLAGARADPTSARARIVRAEAAIQPEVRRKGFDILTTLMSSVEFGIRLERTMHLSK